MQCALPFIAATWRGDLPDAGFIQLTIPPTIVRCSPLVDKECKSPSTSFAAAARCTSHENSALSVVATSAAVHAHGAPASGSSCCVSEMTIAGVGLRVGEVSRTICPSVLPIASKFASIVAVRVPRGILVSSPRNGSPTSLRTPSAESSGLDRR